MGLFGNKPIKEFEIGEFTVKFYYQENDFENTYLEIGTTSGAWSMRISGTAHAYGYLLESANQELYDNIHGYATLLYVSAMCMTEDQGLTDDLTRSVNKFTKRLLKRGEKNAKSVTDVQLQADEAFMGDVVSESTMSKKELAKKREEDREILKDLLNEQ